MNILSGIPAEPGWYVGCVAIPEGGIYGVLHWDGRVWDKGRVLWVFDEVFPSSQAARDCIDKKLMP